MLPRRIASRYAEALFDLAQQQGTTEKWERELATLAAVIAGMPDLSVLLTHPEVPLERKKGVMTRAFHGTIAQEVLAVLFLLIKRGHEPDMDSLHQVYMQRWNATRKVVPVAVASAIPLSEHQQKELTRVLAARTGGTIKLQATVDPTLIAGLTVTIGDRVIDASTRTLLQDLRTTLAG
jgi:F-type H+-transporting ATPase subunit delta